MPLQHTLSHGIPTALRLLGDPVRRIKYARREVDEVSDSWIAPSATALSEGDPHPTLPGCIVDQITVTGPFGSAGEQVWEYDVTSLGDARGTQPTKILSRGKSRTIEGGWDQRTVRYLSWHADWRGCTAVASTDIVTTLAANGFITGQRVMFARLTGGAGISSQGTSSLGTVYFWRRLSGTTGTLHTTAAGAAANTGLVDITTDMTAGEIIAAEFALGAPHPDHATMYLAELQMEDDNNDWRTANVTYRGLEEGKPFHRMVSVNGQSFSSGDKMTVSLAGGWGTPRYTNVHLPEVVVTDTYLTGSTTLPTSSVPAFETPPNAPAITSIVLEGDEERLVYNYPYGWTLVSAPHAATLNYLINAMTYQKVYRYIHPVMIR